MKRRNMLGLATVAALFFWAAGPVLATTHTWTQTVGGAQSWEDNGNWSGGTWPTPASGDTVDFSTVTFTTNTTLTLGADRTAEVWKFGDTGSTWDWTIAASNKIILAGTTPTIDVVNRTATLLNGLDGSAGLTKTGSGTLTIGSTNTYSGATTVSQGTLRLATSLAPVSGAVLWLDAAAGSTVMTSGGTITNWSSLGSYSGAVTASGGLAPTYVANGLNGLPVARFNDAQYLSNTGLLTAGNFPNSQATVFIVYALTNDNAYGLAWTGVGNDEWQRYDGNGQPYMGMFRQSRVEGGVVVPNTGAHLLTLTGNKPGNSYVMTVDGGTNVNTTFTPSFAFGTAFRVGESCGRWLKGDIAEVLIYNTALSAADQATVNTYLNAKWFGAGVGAPAALPSSTALSIASGTTFDLNGASAGQTVASLSDAGVVTNSAPNKSTLTINPSSGSTTFSGAIRGPVSLVKTGDGTQVLAGASAYTLDTTVSSGTLLVNGSITGAVSVASGATLGGTGAIMGNVTFATGALALFTNDAPLTFTGPVTLNNNTVHLVLPDNLAEGTYLLATNTTGNFSGVFAAAPVIDSGSTTNRMISTDASAVRLIVSSADLFPPTPNPMTFAVKPWALNASTVVMTATTAMEGMNPPVEYFFENTVNGNTSGWILTTVWTNTGLTTATTYRYRVKARDQLGNETAWSVEADIVTLWTATSLYWDGGTADIAGNGNGASQGGSGTWNTTIRNWDLGSAYPHVAWDNPNNDTAVFSGTADTVTLGTVAAGSVTFTNFTGTYTLTGGSLALSSNLTVAATSGNVTLSTLVSGIGGMVKNGANTLTLNNTSTYTGGTVLNGGVTDQANLVDGVFGTGPVTLNNGASVQFSRQNEGSIKSTNQWIINSGKFIGGNSFGDSNYGAITLNGTLTVETGGTGNRTLKGIISGTGRILKAGSGTGALYLFGANTYSGGTSNQGGLLGLGHTNALGTGTLWMDGASQTLTAEANLNVGTGVTNSIVLLKDCTVRLWGNWPPVSNDMLLSGPISGPGGITLTGGNNANKTLFLSGTNTYTGTTTITNWGNLVVSGSLASTNIVVSATRTLVLLNNTSLSTNTVLRYAVGATNTLSYTGRMYIQDLYTNNVPLPDGEYSSENLPEFITGTGRLNTGPLPPKGLLILFF